MNFTCFLPLPDPSSAKDPFTSAIPCLERQAGCSSLINSHRRGLARKAAGIRPCVITTNYTFLPGACQFLVSFYENGI